MPIANATDDLTIRRLSELVARQHDGPCMIVARTDNSRSSIESTVWWDIPAAPSSEHTDMTELRQAYERGHADQRHHL